MGYKGIPEDQLGPKKEKILVPALEKQGTTKLLDKFPDVAVYGLLLLADPEHPLGEVLRTRWSELHHLTGDRILLVAFDTPEEWTPAIKEFWQEQLGGSFRKVWSDWKKGRGTEPGAAFNYLDLFSDKIKASDLPCLALFTKPDSKEAVIRSIPNWDTDSLYRFLVSQIEAIQDCCSSPDDDRLECLRGSLTSLGVRAKASLGHYVEKALDYVKQHPVQVASASISVVVALATANVLPLTGTGLAVLKTLKDAFSKG